MNGEKAVKLFSNGYLCGESVLLAASEAVDIKSSMIPAAATGFCSGFSRTCGLCGAVAGATIAINMVHGRTSPEEKVEHSYKRVQKLRSEFLDRFGSDNCRELTGCDLSTPDGQQKFKENCIKSKLCLELVRWCTDKCIEII